MKPKKVYLSVSYNTSASVIREVQNIFESFGVEVLQYCKGDYYTTEKLLDSDIVIGIPSDEGRQTITEYGALHLNVGKGQYKEAGVAIDNNIPYYLLHKGFGTFTMLHGTIPIDLESWKIDYGKLILQNTYTISDLLNATKITRRRLLLLN